MVAVHDLVDDTGEMGARAIQIIHQEIGEELA